jgi:hypothetical protein
VALLATLVLIFAFEAENILNKWTVVLLLAVPILIHVYFNAGLTYGLMRLFRVPHNVATPGSLMGPSTSSSWQSPWRSRSSGRQGRQLWPRWLQIIHSRLLA